MPKNKSTRTTTASADTHGNVEPVSHRLKTIKPPPAPAVVQSDDVGAPISRDRAIREKMRMYPKATVQEIVAMFELDGVRVSPASVEKARRNATP